MGSEASQSAGFVLTHEAAVAGDIGGEDGREPAINPLSAQDVLPTTAAHSLLNALYRRLAARHRH
jgi:hypothetical protein